MVDKAVTEKRVNRQEPEFYNMYEMYQDNGISADIALNQMIVNYFRRNHQQESDNMFGFHEFGMGSYLHQLTDGFLSQSELIDDDLLLMTHSSGFERILIFDRPDHHKDLAMRLHGREDINLNKSIFMRLFYSIMSMIVHADDKVQGYFGIMKPILKPKNEYRLESEIIGQKDETDFQAKNAIVSNKYLMYKPEKNEENEVTK